MERECERERSGELHFSRTAGHSLHNKDRCLDREMCTAFDPCNNKMTTERIIDLYIKDVKFQFSLSEISLPACPDVDCQL